MRKVSIITCFTYSSNERYLFSPQYLASDLKKVILFSINNVNCLPEDLYVFTDLPRSEAVRIELLSSFRLKVRRRLLEQGVPKNLIIRMERDSKQYEDTPSIWLKSIARVGEMTVGSLLPEITEKNVVEIAALFMNLVLISGEKSFSNALKSVLSTEMTHLLFYYTGHGVSVPLVNGNRRISLLIPKGNSVEQQSKERFQELLRPTLETVNCFMLFDCCHSSNLIELQHNITFTPREIKQNASARRFVPETICITSTTNDQTCGFFNSKAEKGSLFTHYLFKHLKSCGEEERLSQLEDQVERRIGFYRQARGKPEQNLTVSMTDLKVRRFPSWLFR